MALKTVAVVFLSGIVGFATLSAPSTASQLSAAQDGKTKINVSGRNRMLSQRMAKAVCFASIDVDKAAHIEMALAAHAEFDKALKGLRHGNADLGILQETTPAILTELDGVDTLWATYGSAIASSAKNGGFTADALNQIPDLSIPTLIQMNKAVRQFEKRYGASDIHPSLALAINISGRQRMLSQKSSKEFCLTVAGYAPNESRAALASTVDLFETSLIALMDGSDDLGLPEAPTDEIYEQLERVQELWAPVAAIFKMTSDGGTPTEQQVQFVATQNNTILVEMNNAVGMYAGL